MRKTCKIFGVAILLAGCSPTPATGPRPVVEPPAARVDVGGPQGGVHVDAPARRPGGGADVDVDGTGVHVRTPNTKVDVP